MKTTVAVIFGGRSVEHEIAIISAVQAMGNINKDKYNVMSVPCLIIDDSKVTYEGYTGPTIFGSFHRNLEEKDLYPYIAEGVVNLNNIKILSGKTLGLSSNPELFKDYTIIEK